MNTCVICGVAYDPVVSEDGKELIDNATGICLNCLKNMKTRK